MCVCARACVRLVCTRACWGVVRRCERRTDASVPAPACWGGGTGADAADDHGELAGEDVEVHPLQPELPRPAPRSLSRPAGPGIPAAANRGLRLAPDTFDRSLSSNQGGPGVMI